MNFSEIVCIIPCIDWMRVVEDGVEADEVLVRIGSVIAFRSLVSYTAVRTTDFQSDLEGNAPVDSHVPR